ncbi:MAG: PPOX class F420-dependent oxidoreductase [Dehalococcoidia bacterium]
MTTAPTAMTRDQIEEFLAQPQNIIVAAIRKDGRPQVTPNWFYWDGNRFYISTTKSRQKYKNLRRDPRVQLVLDEPSGFRTLLIDGTTEIWEDHERGLPFFKKITEKHTGRTPDDTTLRERLEREGRVLLVITPEKPPEQWTRWMR